MGFTGKGLEVATGKFTSADGFGITTVFRGPLTEVTVITEEGVYARAYAKQHPDDEYDEHVGENLASFRAIQRVFRKLEKKTIRELK